MSKSNEAAEPLLIAGTVPLKDTPLLIGEIGREGEFLLADGVRIPATQGTGAMISAAFTVTEYLKLPPPQVALAGDTGGGQGSRAVYEYLIENVARLAPAVLALHYCLPDMPMMRRLCRAVKDCPKRPVMIADAGAMYAAKEAGLSGEFDIFTPDATELAFLADPQATHPAYIQRHLFSAEAGTAPALAVRAYRDRNAARLLLIKGSTDYIVRDGDIMCRISDPDVPELEAIGGTGDTITGLVAGFSLAGLEPYQAAVMAARTNRTAGELAGVTPASRVWEIIARFPAVFKENLCQWSGICTNRNI